MTGAMGYGAAANVLGGLMQSIAASQANKEMGETFAREMQNQQKYRNQAFGTFEESAPNRGVETARTQIAEGADKRQDFFQKTGESSFTTGQDPRTARDRQQYTMSGQARANLGGYSDWALNQAISNLRTQDELNRLSSFAGGDAQVFPFKMDEAAHSWDELAFWGALIASVGGGAGSFLPQGGAAGQQQPLAFGGQSSPASGGFGVPTGFTDPYQGQV